MLFGHKVKGSFPFEKFEEDLKKHSFIKDIEVLPFTSKPLYTALLNSYISIKRHLSSILPSVFGIKLTGKLHEDEKRISDQDKLLISKCKKMKTKDDKPIIMVNINKNNKSNANNDEYAKSVISNLFPIIESRFVVTGKPESEYWDMIALVKYQSQKSLCEMVLSEEYQSIWHLKANGLEDSYTSMTATVMSYQKDLLE